MTISYLQPLAVGNAVRVIITPPKGAVYWNVLRRTSDAFTGPADTGAVTVASTTTDNAVLDTTGLENDTPYFYAVYYWMGSAWSAPDIGTVTPAATYVGDDIDPQTIVRDRLALGLVAEVAAGRLQPTSGVVPVYTAPFGMVEGVTFPCVSVHLSSDAPAVRGLGEMLAADYPDLTTLDRFDVEGWLSTVGLNVVGVSQNSDERIDLRRAIDRVLKANLGVFSSLGLVLPQWSMTDDEQFSEDNAPLYFVRCSFSCQAPTFVQADIGQITDIDSTATAFVE